MARANRFASIGLAMAVVACSRGAVRVDTYADALLERPVPKNDQERILECAWIRHEIAQQESLGRHGAKTAKTPLMAALLETIAQRHVAALVSRAANIQCPAGLVNSPPDTAAGKIR